MGFKSIVGAGSTFWVDLPLANGRLKEIISAKGKETG
jgi:hypothetical protein